MVDVNESLEFPQLHRHKLVTSADWTNSSVRPTSHRAEALSCIL